MDSYRLGELWYLCFITSNDPKSASWPCWHKAIHSTDRPELLIKGTDHEQTVYGIWSTYTTPETESTLLILLPLTIGKTLETKSTLLILLPLWEALEVKIRPADAVWATAERWGADRGAASREGFSRSRWGTWRMVICGRRWTCY
jgi:hypothetical protein